MNYAYEFNVEYIQLDFYWFTETLMNKKIQFFTNSRDN